MALFKKKAPQRAATYTARSEERVTEKSLKDALEIVREIKIKLNYDTFKQDKKDIEQRIQRNNYLVKKKEFCSKVKEGLSIRDLEYLENMEKRIKAELT